MKVTKIKFTRPNATVPQKAHKLDAGYDLTAAAVEYNFLKNQVRVFTGISVTPPEGYYFEVFPRSSVSKLKLQLANSVGIIDPEYTGEIMLVFDYIGIEGQMRDLVSAGDRVAQLVLKKLEETEFHEVDELNTTSRGEGGFGSTGV
jgi:dUTP pyrophosphatase